MLTTSANTAGMRISAIAAWAPPDVWSNARIAERLQCESKRFATELGRELTADEAELFKTNDRWIRRFIGFTERRFVKPGEGTIDLAVNATKLLIELTGTNPRNYDEIIFTTVTPSFLNSPPDSSLLQNALGIPELDGKTPHELAGSTESQACTSWVVGLRQAYASIRAGLAERILLIGADTMSTTINWRDRAFATVLGDAGTAVECVATTPQADWFKPRFFWNWLGGSKASTIITPFGGSKSPLRSPQDVTEYRNCLTMDGRQVREDMVPFIGGPLMEAALQKAGLNFGDLDLAVLHEANLMLNGEIIKQWREYGFRGDVLDAGGKFGNTTSATIPLALALNPGKLELEKRFALVSFGGGYSASIAFGTIKHPLRVAANV